MPSRAEGVGKTETGHDPKQADRSKHETGSEDEHEIDDTGFYGFHDISPGILDSTSGTQTVAAGRRCFAYAG